MLAAIVDYGIGNTFSIRNTLEKIGIRSVLTKDSETIKRADLVVLPGVGSHKAAMSNIERYGLLKYLTEPRNWILGICLGLQLLFERSEEGGLRGLGLVKGEVIRFRNVRKVPHMGWNEVEVKGGEFSELNGRNFYFAHSYYVPSPNPYEVGVTEYSGTRFVSILVKGNVIGTQFHPEKSSRNGKAFLTILRDIIRR
ncbi:imidazole glycerol phosphate synthase [Ignicoccus islandicus DSM 13165]|uniref:Imidazole glycerol phosphate synthase subunit HisH n=1 Tax=Ignicoccus islandicus DSM 13165 TaxID=940295 RepID=A0A0U3F7H1_9CREN|nr:imidazole glycerol phosphate synthase subunit HisH [Ignicoccus islandicus]ALU11992.1 imidazole glycerol phosphate synthase [Ignicoccus islandicus DSM 13165]